MLIAPSVAPNAIADKNRIAFDIFFVPSVDGNGIVFVFDPDGIMRSGVLLSDNGTWALASGHG